MHRETQAKGIGGMSNRVRKDTNSEKGLTFPGRGKVPVEYSGEGRVWDTSVGWQLSQSSGYLSSFGDKSDYYKKVKK